LASVLVACGVVLGACSFSQHPSTPTAITHTRAPAVAASQSAADRLCHSFQQRHFPRDVVEDARPSDATTPETACTLLLEPVFPCPNKVHGTTAMGGVRIAYLVRANGTDASFTSMGRQCPPDAAVPQRTTQSPGTPLMNLPVAVDR
jgi:hypothetical protein